MRAWFLGRLFREKLILLLFLVLAAFLWVSSVSERFGTTLRDIKIVSAELDEQASWLAIQDRTEASARAAINDLDPSRTYNQVRLSAAIEALTRDAGIAENARSDLEPSAVTAEFTVHTVRLSLTRAHWSSLVNFNNALADLAPYISIEEISMRSDRSDPDGALMNASLKISSVEITR